jgi:WD40 repeat protein
MHAACRLGYVIGLMVMAAPLPAEETSFKEHVAPILVRKCLGCHNDKKHEGGLNLKTVALLKRGGKTMPGEAIVAGDPDSSYLIELVRPDAEPRMPFKLPPLSDAEIRTLERWIAAGAKLEDGLTDETLLTEIADPLKDLPAVAVRVPTADPVTALVFSPDGTMLAAGRGATVLLFDTASNREVARLEDHPGPVTALRFTPDGRSLIATGGRPGRFGSVIVWDVATRSKRHDLRGHGDAILAAALAPDGKALATASYDRLITLWDVAEGRAIRDLKEHTDSVHGLSFSPDGASLASASADRTIKVWDVASGRRRVTLSDAMAELYAVRYAPDGTTVLGAGVDRTIRAWRVEGDAAEPIRSTIAHDGPILRLVVGPDGRTLYSCSEDRTVKLWDLATLAPRAALPSQADWPLDLAIHPDGSRLAVGRYDGTLALLDPGSGLAIAQLLDAPKAPRDEDVQAASAEKPEPPKPQLFRLASLAAPSPRGGTRGTTVRVALSGNGVGEADTILFPEQGITAAIVRAEKPDKNRLDLDLTISPDARVGSHAFVVRTPLGTPAAQSFVVSAYPEVPLAEPDDDPSATRLVTLPATILGTIDKPGDVDTFRFDAKAGQMLAFDTLARRLGSGLDATLTVQDDSGAILATAEDSDDSVDPLLVFQPPADGTYTLRISDAEYGGSGNHFYRVSVGETPRIATVFPLGVESGTTAMLDVRGVNLQGVTSVPMTVAPGTATGTVLGVTVALPDGSRPHQGRQVVAAEGAQAVESESNDDPASAGAVSVPGGLSGVIGPPGDVDHVRFEARKGHRVIVEVYGRRLGTLLDPVIEILDDRGRPVPRAVLRPVAETNLTFRDHNSAGRTFRLTVWNDLAIGDTILVGREVLGVVEMPRNPDDEILVTGLGNGRISPGERVGLLETTPEHHAMGQSFYKVEVHPPGTEFPPGGAAPVTIPYRNDDGGPGFNKDARLTFDPPADGMYYVRVEDVRGLGGEGFGYHLVMREPRPDFRLSFSTDNPNVPRGGTAVITANIQRIDGFEGPVDVALDGLPPGVTASATRIEAGLYAADIVLVADGTAPGHSDPTWIATATATVEGREVTHQVDPGGPKGGWITVTGEPNLKVNPRTDRVTLRPGERIELTFGVERSPAFEGRVPIDVRNLPQGVRVENIGLNGVLVTETQTERNVFLYAEPWVKPMERPFFAVGKCESAGTEHSSPPITLVIEPK